MRLAQLPVIALATLAAAKPATEKAVSEPLLDSCKALTHQAKSFHDFVDLKPASQFGKNEFDEAGLRGRLLGHGLNAHSAVREIQPHLEFLEKTWKDFMGLGVSPNEKKVVFPPKASDVCRPKEKLDDCEDALLHSVKQLFPKLTQVADAEAAYKYEHSLAGRLNKVKQHVTSWFKAPGTDAGEKVTEAKVRHTA